jgi:hypothetical protein
MLILIKVHSGRTRGSERWRARSSRRRDPMNSRFETTMAGNLQALRKQWIALVSSIPTILIPFGAAHAQSIPEQYQFALQRAEYRVFMGDVNGDGFPDVLVKAQVKLTFVHIDEMLAPILLKPASPTFVLLSSGGTYSLTKSPNAALLITLRGRPAATIWSLVMCSGRATMRCC